MNNKQYENLAMAIISGILLLFFLTPQVMAVLSSAIPNRTVRTFTMVIFYVAIVYIIHGAISTKTMCDTHIINLD